MQNNTWAWVIGIIVVVLVIGGIVFARGGSAPAAPAGTSGAVQVQATSSPVVSTTTTTTTTAATGTAAAPTPMKFAVNGNDASADLTSITVKKGTPVTITFGADAAGTYHGGLDFRSSVVSSGTIAPGSTKTVQFVADQSFSFTPYWPATNIAKPYKITVTVD